MSTRKRLPVGEWFNIPGRGRVMVHTEDVFGEVSPGDEVEIGGTAYLVRGVERMGRQKKVGLVLGDIVKTPEERIKELEDAIKKHHAEACYGGALSYQDNNKMLWKHVGK